MGLPAVVVLMITLASTAARILRMVKCRCGASQAIIQLTSRCVDLVEKIRKLLKTLKEGAQVPHDTRGISTALNLRREEFDAVLSNLEKMNRRTKRTHPIDRTEKFILAQGWAKKMEAIHDDLVHLRNGIETIVSSWDSAQFVGTKVEEIATIDVTNKKQPGSREQHMEIDMMGDGGTSYGDRIKMTTVNLTDANKAALNHFGNLDKLSLPAALFQASQALCYSDKTSRIQLWQRSAELLYAGANYRLGLFYRNGQCSKRSRFGSISFPTC